MSSKYRRTYGVFNNDDSWVVNALYLQFNRWFRICIDIDGVDGFMDWELIGPLDTQWETRIYVTNIWDIVRPNAFAGYLGQQEMYLNIPTYPSYQTTVLVYLELLRTR